MAPPNVATPSDEPSALSGAVARRARPVLFAANAEAAKTIKNMDRRTVRRFGMTALPVDIGSIATTFARIATVMPKRIGQLWVIRRPGGQHQRRADAVVGARRHVVAGKLRDQAEKERAVALAGRGAAADGSLERERDIRAGADGGEDVDVAEAAFRDDEDIVLDAVAVEVESRVRAEVDRQPRDRWNRRDPDNVAQVDAVLVDPEAGRRRAGRGFVVARLQEALRPDRRAEVLHGDFARGIEDAIDRGSGDVDDRERLRERSRGDREQQDSEKFLHAISSSRSLVRELGKTFQLVRLAQSSERRKTVCPTQSRC